MNIVAALADPNARRAVGGPTLGLLEAAVGKDDAWELEGERMSAVSALLQTRDRLSQMMESASRDMEQAETFIRGGGARFNSLGILQGRGSEIDRLCGMFDLQVQAAVKAEFAIVKAIAQAQDDEPAGRVLLRHFATSMGGDFDPDLPPSGGGALY